MGQAERDAPKEQVQGRAPHVYGGPLGTKARCLPPYQPKEQTEPKTDDLGQSAYGALQEQQVDGQQHQAGSQAQQQPTGSDGELLA